MRLYLRTISFSWFSSQRCSSHHFNLIRQWKHIPLLLFEYLFCRIFLYLHFWVAEDRLLSVRDVIYQEINSNSSMYINLLLLDLYVLALATELNWQETLVHEIHVLQYWDQTPCTWNTCTPALRSEPLYMKHLYSSIEIRALVHETLVLQYWDQNPCTLNICCACQTLLKCWMCSWPQKGWESRFIVCEHWWKKSNIFNTIVTCPVMFYRTCHNLGF